MKSFVLTYVRPTGELEVRTCTGPTRRQDAFRYRLELERQVGADTEVVVLHAESLEALKQTHGRYWFTASELLSTMRSQLSRA